MPARLSDAEIAHYRSEGKEIPTFRWILLHGQCRRSNIPTLRPPVEDRVPAGSNQFGSDDG